MNSRYPAPGLAAPEVLNIRPITPEDNAAVAQLVRATLEEHQCIGPGFASSDPELDDLHAAYQTLDRLIPDRGYWVIADDAGHVWGGGGFSRLKGTRPDESICELQKVYFHPGLRGRGYGRRLTEFCMREAEKAGYQTMYLETMPQMASALGLYRKLGFQPLPTYLGDTGHRSCTVFMSRPLGAAVTVCSTP
jgi:putative acetyltransferase